MAKKSTRKNAASNFTEGIGIGLTVSNAIAKTLGGEDMKVESKVGIGTKISFRVSNNKPRVTLPID
jgi:signal transduction histidine kinase